MTAMGHLVAAPDKFRGTASAPEMTAAIARAAASAGWTCDEAPMADGGEGILDALGGARHRTRVQGPLGEVVDAEWRMLGRDHLGPSGPLSGRARAGPSGPLSGRARAASTAVIEMARAAGLELAGGPEWNDPLRATTAGVGQLIMAAVAEGARRVIVGVGGSATTDGGQGCVDALYPRSRLTGVELVVACDVRTTFVDAARVFAPQKGASPAQVELLSRRLERVAQLYIENYGVDVRATVGSGAAGGLAGGLAAVGASLVPGFDLVADAVDLEERIESADLVVTGEGLLDEQSFVGKTVGGVIELAARANVAVLVVAGEIAAGAPAMPRNVEAVSLVERFGAEASLADAPGCMEQAVRDHVASR